MMGTPYLELSYRLRAVMERMEQSVFTPDFLLEVEGVEVDVADLDVVPGQLAGPRGNWGTQPPPSWPGFGC